MAEQVDALSPAGVSALATFIIRPPRASYSRTELGERTFLSEDVPAMREDITLTNARGCKIQASHFRPTALSPDAPVVVYLHGNGSCRVEATMLIPHVIPYGLALFAFDFSGSGRSEGDFISLGVHEKHDVQTVLDYLVHQCSVKRIVLWGHSMGAATAVMYAGLCQANEALVALVLDSPFASFDKLAHSMVAEMPIPLGVPRKLILSVGVRAVRKVVRERANFDVYDIDPLSAVRKITRPLPAVFLHGSADVVVPLSHGQLLYKNYPCNDKTMLVLQEFEHDTQRPDWAMDRVFVFLQRHLRENGQHDVQFLHQLKGRGNVAMLAGRFTDAVFLYTEALAALSESLRDTDASHHDDEEDPAQNLIRRNSSISNFVGNVKRWRSSRVDQLPRPNKRPNPEQPQRQTRMRPIQTIIDDESSHAISNDLRSDSSAWSGRFSRKSKKPSRARTLMKSIKRKIVPSRTRTPPSTPPSEQPQTPEPSKTPDIDSTITSELARERSQPQRKADGTSGKAFIKRSVSRVRSVSRLSRLSTSKDDRAEGTVHTSEFDIPERAAEKPAHSFEARRRIIPDASTVRTRFSVGDTNLRPKNRRTVTASSASTSLATIDISGWDLDPERKALALALLGNRSLARRKSGEVHGALFDAITSLRLDPTWVRGYLRKAAALRQDGKLAQARRCILDGLLQEPQHAGLIDMLQSIDDALAAEQVEKTNARDASRVDANHPAAAPITGES